MNTSHTLLRKPEIEISLLIRETLICIYLPLTLTPFKCRGQNAWICTPRPPYTLITCLGTIVPLPFHGL